MLMILEFFYVELLITSWEGEHLFENWWIGINNILIFLVSLVSCKRAIDYFSLNVGHKILVEKVRNMRRRDFFGEIDGKLSLYESELAKAHVGSINELT